ncbi:Dihydropteroate synthase [Rhodobacteraceae bacterium THAF1]|uniref:dihydropteroate synthase n=1 Tax=Palleronia sp. THAF1 TaxID=2587842 RepID=UPI000F3CC3B6|nr:dihydropteroate synthase [Palleronia sp. THAF1]QFU07517.1 Dihydropteroate synthase [Palleronia sp. THAF1]VDC20480.1 Dihydropteroate synthase [Rhodobacteraceae bacterium THAF1]
MSYWRPLVQVGPSRPAKALPLAGGWGWFTHLERLERDGSAQVVSADALPDDVQVRLTTPRAHVAGLAMDRPRIMAILNATPDSFSDGGQHEGDAAQAGARRLVGEGADIIDVGGESTRPGAQEVPVDAEIARIQPVIAALRAEWSGVISVDTRKAPVAAAAARAGATMLNDVSALTWDADMATTAADSGLPICLMHAQGDPQTMQDAPHYDDVLLDVYDHLSDRIDAATSAGIDRERIVIDPGIGFGKTLEHNLSLLARLSLFHTLGCPILLGASRKRFIGTIGEADTPGDRMPGSVAVALAGIAQGVQIVRVHDMAATRQALRLWQAATSGETP